MNKQDIYNLLDERNIWYEVIEHNAVYTMNDAYNVEFPHPEADAKNVFVRDDKKRNYYLITIHGNKRVDLKKFREDYNTRQLTFVSEKGLLEILNLTPGSVTPFGLLNDKENKVNFYLDNDFNEESLIAVHPNDNTATVFLKVGDLLDLIKESGNSIEFVNI